MEVSQFISCFLMTLYNEMLLTSFSESKGECTSGVSLNTPLFYTFWVPKRRTTPMSLNSQEHSFTLPSSHRHASVLIPSLSLTGLLAKGRDGALLVFVLPILKPHRSFHV